jgi:hypothetical protein
MQCLVIDFIEIPCKLHENVSVWWGNLVSMKINDLSKVFSAFQCHAQSALLITSHMVWEDNQLSYILVSFCYGKNDIVY